MPSFTSVILAAVAASLAVATPAPIAKRQAGDWTFLYYEGNDHNCSTGPSVTSSTYSGGIGCTQLGLWETVEEAPPGGSVRIQSTGGAVTPKLWFDTACTDPVEIIQNTQDGACYAISYPYQGGPVAITADQAGA